MILWSLLFGGKHEDKRVKNLFPTLVATFFTERRIEPGDVSLYYLFLGFVVAGIFWVVVCPVWFFFFCFFFFFFWGGGVVNFSSFMCPLSFRALLYGFAASSNN